MIGDGVNDSSALKIADVELLWVSMVLVCRELLDLSFG